MALYPLGQTIDDPAIVMDEYSSDQSDLGSAVDQMSTATDSFVGSIAATVNNMLAETVSFTQETNGYDLQALLDLLNVSVQPPTFQATTVAQTRPNFEGGSLDYTEPTIAVSDPPPMNLINPDINIPPVPNLDIPPFTEAAPDIDTPVLPTRPSYTLPPMPTITDITIPDPPTYDIPDFEGSLPVFDMTPPSGTLDWAESTYGSQLKTQIDGELATDVTTDVTGLDSAYENGIYDRARSRQEGEHARTLTEGANFFGSRGFQLPGIALASIQTEVQNRISQIRTDLENDIDIQAAKLTDEHSRFVKGTAISWEDKLIAYYDNAQARGLQAAQATIEVMIVVYQTKVEGYKAQMSAYSSMADAYRSRISAELGKAEFYKAQIEGKKMAVEAQSTLIEAYTAQVESVFTLADIYTAEMDAARIQSEIDKIKMEAYSVKVRAYRYQVEALAATYQVYLAQIQGEEAKVKMYQSLVEAYEAEVDGHVAKARVLIANLQIQVENLKAQAEIFAAQIRKYQADTRATVGLAETRVLSQSADNTDYDARSRPQIAKMSARGRISNSAAQERAALENATARMNAAVIKAQANLKEIEAQTAAVITRSNARRSASLIARHSKSENWSNTNIRSDAKTTSKVFSMNNNSSDSIKVGQYHKTYN